MTQIDVEKFRVVGIAVRTSQRIEASTKKRIPPLWKRFVEENIIIRFHRRLSPQRYMLFIVNMTPTTLVNTPISSASRFRISAIFLKG